MEYHDQVIDNLGVSKRLGNSVLSELDLRALGKASSLDSHLQDEKPQDTAGDRFESSHKTEFISMQSIESHYAAHKNSTIEERCFSDQNEMIVDAVESESDKPGTPKRSSEQDLHSSSKRMRDRNGKSRDSDVFVYSPVSDITRRIRRLRVRNQAPREKRSEINRVRNTPLSGSAASNQLPPPKISFNSRQATFAKPTFTSINRETKPGAIFSKLKKPEAKPKARSNTLAPPLPPLPSSGRNSVSSKPQEKPPVVAPTSVFQRLYEQSTFSRSNSSNAIAAQKRSLQKSQTMRNLRPENSNSVESRTTATTSMPRSKSSYTISTKESASERIPRSTSTSFNKPTWRWAGWHLQRSKN